MKKKLIIFLMIILLQQNIYSYTDVKNTWAEKYIKWSTERGIFEGYKDGSFRPKSEITNAEFIKVLSGLITDDNFVESKFDDVPEDAWYKNHLEKVLSIKLLKNSGSFKPNEKITRIEAFRLIAGIYNLQSNIKGKIDFNDVEIVDNRAGIITLVKDKIISGDNYGNLNPLSPITRAEVCKILKLTNDKYGR